MTLMRVIDAYKRGYITEAEYLNYLSTGYTNSSMIDVTVDPHVYAPYGATMRLIKRDPNLRQELEIEIEGSGAQGVLVQGDKNYAHIAYNGRIVGYFAIVDTQCSAVLDVWVKSTFPPEAAQSITASAKPTITTAVYTTGNEAEVSTWSKNLTAEDFICVEVDSNDNAHRVVVTLIIEPATQLNALV